MNIQIYWLKKTFDVQKAERWFKERRLPYHLVDLKKARMGPRELQNIAARAGGARALIDTEASGYAQSPLPRLRHDQSILDALLADQRLIRMPIVRDGPKATVGYAPEIWEEWAKETDK